MEEFKKMAIKEKPSDNERERRSKALINKQAQLDILEPFTSREKRGLGKRNMAFIRDLQISRRISKKEAIELYANTNLKSKEHLEKLENEVQQKIKDYYSKKKQFNIPTDGEAPKKVTKEKTKREKAQEKKIKEWKKAQKKELSLYFNSLKYRNTPTYERIKAAHKQYPDATKYELVHGVNSKASQKYRLEHGLKQEYTGRVKGIFRNNTKTFKEGS